MLETVYFVSQSFAAIAVLASLYFVGMQIRQNTRAIRAASRHENDMDWAHLNYKMAEDSETARLFALLQDTDLSIDDVSESDLVPLHLIFRSVIMTFQAHYFLSLEGSLPEEHWVWERNYARRLIKTPVGSVVYAMELEQGAIRDGFREEIEAETNVGVFDLGVKGVQHALGEAGHGAPTSENGKSTVSGG